MELTDGHRAKSAQDVSQPGFLGMRIVVRRPRREVANRDTVHDAKPASLRPEQGPLDIKPVAHAEVVGGLTGGCGTHDDPRAERGYYAPHVPS